MLPEVFTIEELSRLRKYYQSFSRISSPVHSPSAMQKIDAAKKLGNTFRDYVDTCYEHGTWYDAGELEKSGNSLCMAV